MGLPFRDRYHAGAELAAGLTRYTNHPDARVLALPRGGVPVAYEVAQRLRVPLDLFLVRKLGVPGHEELAFGAIASGGVRVLSEYVVRSVRLPDHVIATVTEHETAELRRRESLYRPGRPPVDVHGCIVIVVDDGLATGSTMLAAVRALRQLQARDIVVAVPVASREARNLIGREADDVVCYAAPADFRAVGQWYEDFSQTSDEEVRRLLEDHERSLRLDSAGRA